MRSHWISISAWVAAAELARAVASPECQPAYTRADKDAAADQHTGEGAERPKQATRAAPLPPAVCVIHDRYAR